jgi:uncharacterized membrane protein YhaH (DUF805 family)
LISRLRKQSGLMLAMLTSTNKKRLHFMQHFTAAFRNFANFNDRANRTQYWMFILIYLLITLAITGFEIMIGLPFLSFVWSLVMLIPSLSYAARRLHDTGRSGWWQLILLIPVIGLIALIVMLAMPSKEEAAERFSLQAP